MRELVEDDLGQIQVRFEDQRVQPRIGKPAQSGVSLDPIDLDVVAFRAQTGGAGLGVRLRKVAAVLEASHERVPPLLRLQGSRGGSVHVPSPTPEADGAGALL